MKAVADMSMPEWHAALNAESALVADELTSANSALENKAASAMEAQLALAITFLAKERVWRKDLDARVKKLEQRMR